MSVSIFIRLRSDQIRSDQVSLVQQVSLVWCCLTAWLTDCLPDSLADWLIASHENAIQYSTIFKLN